MDKHNTSLPEGTRRLKEEVQPDGSSSDPLAFETPQKEAATSQQRQTEQVRQANEERLRLALEAGRLGCWDYDLSHHTLFFDEPCQTILGISLEGFLNAQQAGQLIHPEDLDQLITKPVKPRSSLASRRAAERQPWDIRAFSFL